MDVAGQGHNRPADPVRGADTSPVAGQEFVLGPFTLKASQRLLLCHSVPMALGERAVSILLLLVRQAGQLVTKEQLMAEAWGGLAVEEGNLTVQIPASAERCPPSQTKRTGSKLCPDADTASSDPFQPA
jgi:DNA-binding response OmpR family regulator